MDGRFLTEHETAYLLGLSPETIRKRLESGEIVSVRVNDKYMIPIKHVKQLLGLSTTPPTYIRNEEDIVE